MTDPIREILGWYRSENLGVLTNLTRILNHGRLGGTGKLVILPVDQGFEHGPGRSFAPNPPSYDPRYFPQLVIEARLNAYTAPLGLLEAGIADYVGEIPTILKLNNHDVLHAEKEPLGARTASVSQALSLGCVGIGYTIYPGTAERRLEYEQLQELAQEAKAAGLVVVVWSYPRGGSLSKDGETALDVVAYGARIAADLGAHIIKVKLPSAHIELKAAQKIYNEDSIPRETLAERVRHVMQSAFDGRRLVLFSGGPKENDNHVLLDQVRAVRDGGGSGSIVGRNVFQRDKTHALQLLDDIIRIYKGEIK
jgi:class I fructose-bisphosphate aldolase